MMFSTDFLIIFYGSIATGLLVYIASTLKQILAAVSAGERRDG